MQLKRICNFLVARKISFLAITESKLQLRSIWAIVLVKTSLYHVQMPYFLTQALTPNLSISTKYALTGMKHDLC
jgi:hypothetical protein